MTALLLNCRGEGCACRALRLNQVAMVDASTRRFGYAPTCDSESWALFGQSTQLPIATATLGLAPPLPRRVAGHRDAATGQHRRPDPDVVGLRAGRPGIQVQLAHAR